MQTACTLLLALGVVAAQPADFAGSSPSRNPLDFCKVTIIDEVQVPAEEAGVLKSLNVREGAMVEKGALLGQIDDRDAKLALEIAAKEYEAAQKEAGNDLNVRAAEKNHAVAVAEYEGVLEANKMSLGAVTKTEVRRKKLMAERADMTIEQAQHELEIAKLTAASKYTQAQRAQLMFERRKIVSSINGIVVEVLKHAGDWVAPGETVMRIVRMDQFRVEGFVDGSQYPRHEVLHRPVEIEVQLTGGSTVKLESKISHASPMVESNEYRVWAEIDNHKINGQWLLNPGLGATMRLTGGSRAQAQVHNDIR